MRTNIKIKAVCSICGNELEADGDKSAMEYDSASDATAKMAIKPCRICYQKSQRPIKLIKEALAMVED